VQLAFAGAALGVFEEPVEGGAVEVFSVEPGGLNLHGVVDVGEGIGGKENEVGAFSWGDEALLSGAAEKFGGVKSRGLQRGQGSKPRFDEQGASVPARSGTPARNMSPTNCLSAVKRLRWSSNSTVT